MSSGELVVCRNVFPSLSATFGNAPASSNTIWSSRDFAVCRGAKPAYGRGSMCVGKGKSDAPRIPWVVRKKSCLVCRVRIRASGEQRRHELW